MPKDSSVDVVEVLFRCCSNARTAVAPKDRIESSSCMLSTFTDKATGGCGPNKEPTRSLNQTSNGFTTRPGCI